MKVGSLANRELLGVVELQINISLDSAWVCPAVRPMSLSAVKPTVPRQFTCTAGNLGIRRSSSW